MATITVSTGFTGIGITKNTNKKPSYR